MNKKVLAGLLLLLGLLLSACSRSVETPTATEAPAETEVVATIAPDAAECLACHTDKQRLIDTAKPEEIAAETESSGVG